MSASRISAVSGRRVWDSRGNPTVEATVLLTNGVSGRAMAPAGASRGSREALDLRDGGQRLKGLDVQRALANIAGPIATPGETAIPRCVNMRWRSWSFRQGDGMGRFVKQQ